MQNTNEENIIVQISEQLDKENYIANILVRTLYSNNVNDSECYRIIKLFKEKVLGDIEI